jgi:hypothetical protein
MHGNILSLTSKPVSDFIDNKPEMSVKKRNLSRSVGGLFPKWPSRLFSTSKMKINLKRVACF